jgi:glycosidase
MYFTSNHDENTWNGTEYERLGAAAKAFAVLSATVPGMPLVYTGQESALDHRLAFFEKDSIRWDSYPLGDFYTKLLSLKRTNKAMLTDMQGDYNLDFLLDRTQESWFAFIRSRDNNRVLTIINLSPKPVDVKLDRENIAGSYTELFTGQKLQVKNEVSLHLDAWGYRVFVQ